MTSLEIVPTPEESEQAESAMRDVKDKPILRAAISAGVDIILTGDKDFLESGIPRPRSMTPSDFLAFSEPDNGQ